MKDILFRGKRIDNGEWVYGSLVHRTKYYGDDTDKWFVLHGGEFDCDYYDAEEVLPETIGQFTGLKDKNNNPVYENDILSYIGTRWNDDGDIEECVLYCSVKYGEFNCTCCSGVYGWYFDGGDIRCVREYTIVGNITDNAELIQKEEFVDTKEKQLSEKEEIFLAKTYMKAFVDAVKPEKNKGEG